MKLNSILYFSLHAIFTDPAPDSYDAMRADELEASPGPERWELIHKVKGIEVS